MQLLESRFGPIQDARLQVILCQLEQRLLPLVLFQIGPLNQVKVHAHRTIHLAAAAEQAAQRKVQLDRLRVDLDHFDEGFDRLVLLLVEQEVQPLEIRARQRAGFGKQLL